MRVTDQPLPDPGKLGIDDCQVCQLVERPARTRGKKRLEAPHASGKEHVLEIKRARAQLPLKVSFTTEAQTKDWLGRNVFRVDVDGETVPCGTFVKSAGEIIVELEIPPGKHEVVVSSLEKETDAPVKPRRIVYFAREVTVTLR